jgi:hypothetical protein
VSRAPSPAELRPRKWAGLPANAQVDAALRRAAAERVMEWYDVCGEWCIIHTVYDGWGGAEQQPEGVCEADSWLPDQSRDDLARVFKVALPRLGIRRREQATLLLELALTDTRAALCALLDLLNIPVPEGLTNECR